MKTAIIYLRVSTPAQAEKDRDPEGYSIPAQREACLRKAEALGAVVVDEYIDRGESARSADRPYLQAMLERLKESRDVSYVIVHKVDRLARSRADDVMINLAIRKAGANLVSASENIDETPSGMLLHAIMSGVAEFYSLNLATEALKGTTQKAKNGGTPMKAPIGYLNIRDRVDGYEIRTVALDPDRAPLVKWAFEAYATGNYSLNQLLDELTERGLTTIPTRKFAPHPLHLSNLTFMLHNPYYMGIVRYRGVDYPGRHEPLISESLFEKVQQALQANYTAGERTQRHPHYLKGTVFCDKCGSRLGITKANGHGGTYFYFFCIGRMKRKPCTQRYLPVEDVEAAVCRYYAGIVLNNERALGIYKELEAHIDRERGRRGKEEARQTRRIARLRQESVKLLQLAAYKESMPKDIFEAEQRRIKTELEGAESALGRAALNADQTKRAGERALTLMGDCQAAYTEAAPALRRQWNQSFFTKLFVSSDLKIRGELAAPFAQIVDLDYARQMQRNKEKTPAIKALFRRLFTWETPNPALLSFGRGSNNAYLVGAAGIEPATFCL